MSMKSPISFNDHYKKKLAEKFGVHPHTIYTAIKGWHNSSIANKIRKEVKEMLLEEAEKIIIENNNE